WVMRHTTENAETGLKWTVTNRLEDPDFADDISHLSHSQQHAQSKLARLAEVAGQVGLEINVNKTEVLRANIQNDGSIQLQGHSIRETDRFLYLGSILRKNGGADEDAKSRANQARFAFNALRPI
ncbi:hypothetical protein, partial [Acinetobacter baumannii]|uniref:hypothetical protein n=1 Tax=Acinetobacter baumannii TaxID=470 RepID=UPI003392334C